METWERAFESERHHGTIWLTLSMARLFSVLCCLLSVCFEGKQRELQASNLEANIGHKEYPRGLQMKAVYVKHITPRKGIRILKCRKIFALESEILSVGIWNLA